MIESVDFLHAVFTKATMGKFKAIFVACVGLCMAAGAGYYLYRKFVSKDGEKENACLMQVKMNHKLIKITRGMKYNNLLAFFELFRPKLI